MIIKIGDNEYCVDGYTSVNELQKLAINSYKQGKEAGRAEERNETIKLIMSFFPDEPCNYNGMDELSDCAYCMNHCDNHNIEECWKNAIENKWAEKIKKCREGSNMISVKHEVTYIGNHNYLRARAHAEEVNGTVVKTWDNLGQTIWVVVWYESAPGYSD